MRVKYNIDTKLFFLVGDPMGHSCSALVNNTMFEQVNQNAICLPVTIPKGKLGEFIEAAKLLKVAGIYLTTPHKEDIIQFLDECDPMSKLFHCVNHVKVVDGKLIGIGLDGLGMGLSIEQAVGNLFGKKVLLIGAGSVAGSIAADLYKRGVRDFIISNRTVGKADSLAELLQNCFPDMCISVGPLKDDFLSKAVVDRDVAIQCTSLGMNSPSHEDFKSLEFMDGLPAECLVADVLYPTSSFLHRAQQQGLKTINGIWMTLNQQNKIMDFHFQTTLSRQSVFEGEEAFEIAFAIRERHQSRIDKTNIT